MNKTLIDNDTLKITADLSSIRTAHQFLQKMQDYFALPDYFGNNFNALDECMRDLSWFDEPNLLIEFKNLGKIKNKKLQDNIKDCLIFYQHHWQNCQDKNIKIVFE